jgi:RNA polymerase sigma-70 factor (ECF subfamily)
MINDALAAMGSRPEFAMPHPVPVHAVPMTSEVTAALGRTGPGRGHGETGPLAAGGTAPPPAPGAVEEHHVETWRLVTLAQAGDGDAFGQLYDRYVDTVFRFVYYRVNDRGLAEDFTSETFLRALRRISTITYQGRDIGAWFITIARNIVLDHLKSARHRLEITTGETIEGGESAPSPETAVLASLSSERLMAAVKQLGDEQRDCVMLRFIQGFSVSETAAVMGKNDGAIKALQHRAVRKLTEILAEDLPWT